MLDALPTESAALAALAVAAHRLNWDREDGTIMIDTGATWAAFQDALIIHAAVRDGWTLDELNAALADDAEAQDWSADLAAGWSDE